MRKRKPLKPGTLVRCKVRTLGGWKGRGTVVEHYAGDVVEIQKCGVPDDGYNGRCILVRDEVAVVRR